MLTADQCDGYAERGRAPGEVKIPRARQRSLMAIEWTVLAAQIERDCSMATAAAFASGLRRPPSEPWSSVTWRPADAARNRDRAARTLRDPSAVDAEAWLARGLFIPLP
ncbi:MAG TPA: hypothetical protein VGC77_01105 [Rhodopseudomonas sp.]|uniref:hypothetical protein n=1 Tax=Rhodopseudomonas sp. TaxID=1078 RepID=UPI002ED85B1A